MKGRVRNDESLFRVSHIRYIQVLMSAQVKIMVEKYRNRIKKSLVIAGSLMMTVLCAASEF